MFYGNHYHQHGAPALAVVERGFDVPASTLNIQFRKSDYAGLAVISTLLGLGAACWFATGLLGITLVDIAAVWENIKVVMVEAMSHTPPDWPMVIT